MKNVLLVFVISLIGTSVSAQICDTITNFNLATDTPTLYGAQGGGALIGHNSFGVYGFAEKITSSFSSAEVTELNFVFGRAETNNPGSAVVTLTVWEDDGGNDAFGIPNAPGTVVATNDVLIADIETDVANQDFTTVTFATPPVVSGDFYVGFQISYAQGDTVGLVTNRSESVPSTLFTDVTPLGFPGWGRMDSLAGTNISGLILVDVCLVCPNISGVTSSTESSCDTDDGTAEVVASGGDSPYSYEWSDPLSQTTPTANNLAPGTYTVTITDNNGCTATEPVIVDEAESPTVIVNDATTSACGNSDASLTANASGGDGNYLYTWTGGINGGTLSNLGVGSYEVTVTDGNGCTASTSASVSDPGNLSVILNVQHISCNGFDDGEANAIVSGGSGSETFTWSDTGSGSAITGLEPGSVSVTVTDQSCSAVANETITEPDALTFNQSSEDVTCEGGSDGSASVTVSGGTPPYSYAWPSTNSDSVETGLSAADTVSLVITDLNGCQTTANFNIADGESPSATATATDATGSDDNGSVEVQATGGAEPYTYEWDDDDNQTTEIITDLSTGTYTVTVTDNNGCETTASATVDREVAVENIEEIISFQLFPNPTNANVNLKMNMSRSVNVLLEWVNVLGEHVIKEDLGNTSNINRSYDLGQFASGIYFARISIGDQTIIKKVIVNK
ncbi:MAG: T9SS type A sorting domain-containing protein [Chitinophagales bacterium]